MKTNSAIQPIFTFIDLFSGIGGFHYALAKLGGRCVMASDISPCANETYKQNYGITPSGDIYSISSNDIPNFDILCAGFPCQSFSNVGTKGGLQDPRGKLIFEVFRILKDKKPRAFILENVKGLISHDKGKTLALIVSNLEKCGYQTYTQVLEAKDFNLPQIRKRLFFVGIRHDIKIKYTFPKPVPLTKTLAQILGGKTERDCAFTIRIGGRHSGINNRFNWDSYRVDGKVRYLTVSECLQLQGFPSDFALCGNEAEQFIQVGNTVPTNVVEAVGRQLLLTGIFNN